MLIFSENVAINFAIEISVLLKYSNYAEAELFSLQNSKTLSYFKLYYIKSFLHYKSTTPGNECFSFHHCLN
jgi:hypothetical protein